MTCMYWYGDSASAISPTEDFKLVSSVPNSTARNGTTIKSRLGARPTTPIKIITAAKMRMVNFVPTSGMKMSAGKKVPMMLPTVETAKILPATLPRSFRSSETRLMRNGEVMPSNMMGRKKSTIVRRKEPSTIMSEADENRVKSKANTEATGRTIKGIIASKTPATISTLSKVKSCGERSDQ